jgi:hypothetical protein
MSVIPRECLGMSKKPEKPKTRKARAPKAPKAASGTELDLPWRAIVEAQDILNEASKLTNAISLMALDLNEYECGAICYVADAINAKISDGLGMIEAYTKESGLLARRREAARKVAGLA